MSHFPVLGDSKFCLTYVSVNLSSCIIKIVLCEEKTRLLSMSDPLLTYSVFQVLSIILGMVLRTLGPDRETDYDSDDDTTVPARLPLLRNQAQHANLKHV